MRRDGFFSGSYGGDSSKTGPDSRLECRICWHVYDPEKGDDCWHIPPGTPFAALPEHWARPQCDGPKQDFLVIRGER